MLHDRGLSGTLPSLAILSKIEGLVVYNNQISGTLPQDTRGIKLARQLGILTVNNNRISGTLPAVWADLPLDGLVLSKNLVSGTIPNSWGRMRTLHEVSIHTNALSGTVPNGLIGSLHIIRLEASDNFLSGTLPPVLGPQLKLLSLANQSLSGSIPYSNLQKLSLSRNALSGTIPFPSGSHIRFTDLDLAYNRALSGTLPGYRYSKALATLKLVGCDTISGTLPSMPAAKDVWIGPHLYEAGWKGKLSGTLPEDLGAEVGTNHLFAIGVKLSGTIPMSLGGFNGGAFTNLELRITDISGTLPHEFIGGLTRLNGYLDLSSNRLTGTLPTQLGLVGSACTKRGVCEVQPSKPLASLASSSLVGMLFEFNRLSGTIPTQLGKLHPDYCYLNAQPRVWPGPAPTNHFACPLPQHLPATCAAHSGCYAPPPTEPPSAPPPSPSEPPFAPPPARPPTLPPASPPAPPPDPASPIPVPPMQPPPAIPPTPPTTPGPQPFAWTPVWVPIAATLATLAVLALLLRLRLLHRRNEQLTRSRERSEYDLRLLTHATSPELAAPMCMQMQEPQPQHSTPQQPRTADLATARVAHHRPTPAVAPHDSEEAAEAELEATEATFHGEQTSSVSGASQGCDPDPMPLLAGALRFSSHEPPAAITEPTIPRTAVRRPVKLMTLGEATLLPGGFMPREAALPTRPRASSPRSDSEYSCRTDQTPYGCIRLPGMSSASSAINSDAGGRGCVPFAEVRPAPTLPAQAEVVRGASNAS